MRLVEYDDLGDKSMKYLEGYFKNEIYPVLTPQAIDPGRPFPMISNLSMNILVQLVDPQKGTRFARVKIPKNVPRFIFIPRNKEAKTDESLGFSSNVRHVDILPVEKLVTQHLHRLFPAPGGVHRPFRVTRNTDVEITEDESSDLLEAVKDLDRRPFGEVVRLEVGDQVSKEIFDWLVRNFHLAPFQIDRHNRPLAFADLMSLTGVDRPDLKDEPFVPRIPSPCISGAPQFSILRRRDVVLYHPYDSFVPVLDFIRRAATDPKVVAIKQTLYRVGSESPVVDALMTARKNGKQVTAVVELKARFDGNGTSPGRKPEDGGPWCTAWWGSDPRQLCLVVRREARASRGTSTSARGTTTLHGQDLLTSGSSPPTRTPAPLTDSLTP